MCPDPLSVESVPVPPENEKSCIDVLDTGYSGMHYVTHKSHRMQEHKFGVTCPGTLFVESTLVRCKHEKIACRRFTARMHRNALRDPQIPHDAKIQVQCNVSGGDFNGNHIGSTPAGKIVHRCFAPRCTEMHYVTHRSHWMQKDKFGVTCPDVLFVKSVPVPPEHEK
jgi:hypothetical protein